jgi:molybdopterin molybdotransferase
VALGQPRCDARLKVGIVSTGDEILRAGAEFVRGKVYDANGPMLEGLVEAVGARPVLPDKADLVRAAHTEAARSYDVLVISGGASQGAQDHW